jgi:hypothetical protein
MEIQVCIRLQNFDPNTKQFTYALNTKGLPPLSGNPYQIQIGVRYSF